MIRVLHVIDHLGLGGAQTAVLDFLRATDRQAIEAEIAVMHGKGPFFDALIEAGFKVHSLSKAKWPPQYLWSFPALLKSAQYDIVHFHLQASNWLLKPLAALAGSRTRIAHDHSSGDIRFRGYGSLLPDGGSHLFSSHIIAVSDSVREFLHRWEAVPEDAISVIGNGVDTTQFHPCDAEQRKLARKALGLPQDRIIVGAMGRLAYEKNFLMLPRLAEKNPEMLFIVGGSGPEENLLKEMSEKCPSFRLLGTISDRGAFYRALDIFILPSLYEGLPMALLEALASGVPALASRLPGIVAAAGDECELAPAGDLAAFDEKIKALAASASLRYKLATAGRKKVEEAFSASETARQIEILYRHQLGIAIDDRSVHNFSK